MRNFRNKRNNGDGQFVRGQGQPSTFMALLLVGFGAYYYFSQGNNKDILIAQLPQYIQKYIKTTETLEVVGENAVSTKVDVKQEPEVAEEENIPKYVIAHANINAYNNYENGQNVGIVELGSHLSLIDYVENSQGDIEWLNVRANGLSVWIKNNNIEFKF